MATKRTDNTGVDTSGKEPDTALDVTLAPSTACDIDLDASLKQVISQLLSRDDSATESDATQPPRVLLNFQLVKLQQPATSQTLSGHSVKNMVTGPIDLLSYASPPEVDKETTAMPVSMMPDPMSYTAQSDVYTGTSFVETSYTQIGGKDKPFICDLCQKRFATKQQLMQHFLVHTNERKFKCQACSKMFKQLSHLIQHRRVHTGEKPYICRVPGCDRAFSQKANLKQHLRHHGDHEIPVCKPCPFCDESYPSQESMRDHMIEKHIQMPSEKKRKRKKPSESRRRGHEPSSSDGSVSSISDSSDSSDTEAQTPFSSQPIDDQQPASFQASMGPDLASSSPPVSPRQDKTSPSAQVSRRQEKGSSSDPVSQSKNKTLCSDQEDRSQEQISTSRHDNQSNTSARLSLFSLIKQPDKARRNKATRGRHRQQAKDRFRQIPSNGLTKRRKINSHLNMHSSGHESEADAEGSTQRLTRSRKRKVPLEPVVYIERLTEDTCDSREDDECDNNFSEPSVS